MGRHVDKCAYWEGVVFRKSVILLLLLIEGKIWQAVWISCNGSRLDSTRCCATATVASSFFRLLYSSVVYILI